MRTKAAIKYFGTQQALAEAIGLTQPSIAEWGEYPPHLRQLHIQAVTGGKLKAEPECLKPRRKAA